jgi:hypothetical protein
MILMEAKMGQFVGLDVSQEMRGHHRPYPEFGARCFVGADPDRTLLADQYETLPGI